MLRRIKDSDLVGKTIKSIDAGAVNALKITFSDDTTVELLAEVAISIHAGSISGIFVEEMIDNKG